MATNTYTPLATITLTVTDSEIVFSSIPATYRDLIVVCNARTNRSAADEPIRLRFNNDATTGNYSRVSMSGSGSGSGSSYTDSPGEIIIDSAATAASTGSGIFGILNVQIMDYSATDKHKSVLTTSGIASVEVRRQAGRWASTTAVNSITLIPYFANSFVSGSTFSLYGVIA